MISTPSLLAVLLLCTIPLSCIAILLSCVCISVVVGLKNSTHQIQWKEVDAHGFSEGVKGDEDDLGFMEEVNPNKRIAKNKPFTPFEEKVEEDEPFFDEEDPNITSNFQG